MKKNAVENQEQVQVQEVIAEAINAQPEVKSMRKRIIELGKQGLNKTDIVKTMKGEGYDRIRYAYVFVVLKDKGIVVPKKERVYEDKVKEVVEG